jgi:hypothetical protein
MMPAPLFLVQIRMVLSALWAKGSRGFFSHSREGNAGRMASGELKAAFFHMRPDAIIYTAAPTSHRLRSVGAGRGVGTAAPADFDGALPLGMHTPLGGMEKWTCCRGNWLHKRSIPENSVISMDWKCFLSSVFKRVLYRVIMWGS